MSRKALIAIMAMTTATSWIIRKPTAMRPCRLSGSHLSLSILTMMTVLENVSATATYSVSMVAFRSSRISTKPKVIVNASCPRPVASATAPMWRM